MKITDPSCKHAGFGGFLSHVAFLFLPVKSQPCLGLSPLILAEGMRLGFIPQDEFRAKIPILCVCSNSSPQWTPTLHDSRNHD